jgi:hypothetical protein
VRSASAIDHQFVKLTVPHNALKIIKRASAGQFCPDRGNPRKWAIPERDLRARGFAAGRTDFQ